MNTNHIRHTGAATCATAAAALVLMLSACNEDPTYYELPDQPDQMHLRVSAQEIEFEKVKANEPALTFTWDKAVSPVSASDPVTYCIRFFDANMKTENASDTIPVGNATQVSFTHDQLNSIVARWVLPGEPIEVTAQLLAYVHNTQTYVKPIQSIATFVATPYEKYPTYLYLHVIDNATGQEKTERMEQPQLGTGIYSVSLNMAPCTFFFTTSVEPLPAYGQAADGQLEYLEQGTPAPFTSDAAGQRTIIVDTNEPYNDCRVLDIIQLPTPGVIWICGNGCSIGWNTNTPAGHMDMVGSAREPWLYAWTGDFIAGGEIKIGLGNGWGDQFFYAPEANADPVTDHRLQPYRLQDNGGDLKWVPSVSGRYTFTLSLLASDMWTSFEPAN